MELVKIIFETVVVNEIRRYFSEYVLIRRKITLHNRF
jgi:hypothetical protein